MEQRNYRGDLDPDDLADFLVGRYDPQENLQAQRVGQVGMHLVQIGRGDVPKELRHAVSVAIAPAEDKSGLIVTLGQQQWLDAKSATFAAAMTLVGMLVTPFALFALLWPISDAIGSATLPNDIWSTIDSYVAAQGGTLGLTQELQHPHAQD
jgi:hypothetical protein